MQHPIFPHHFMWFLSTVIPMQVKGNVTTVIDRSNLSSVLFQTIFFIQSLCSSTASPDFYAIIKFSIVVYGYQKHERFFQYANIFCFLSKSFRVNTETQNFNYTTTYTEKSSVLNYSKQSHSVWKLLKNVWLFHCAMYIWY